jgi:Ca-activated chloride channel family protein
MMEAMQNLLPAFATQHFSGSITDFHFLRPFWLLLLLPAVLVPIVFALKDQQASDWEQVISARLLAYLQTGSDKKRTRLSTGIIGLLLALVSLAMAGPAWNKVEQPLQKLKEDLVIVLDLSLSMYATDLAPNRITRARQKIQDILQQRNEGNTGLVVYSAGAHVVTPLTEDTRTIAAMLPALNPFIMPAAGSEPAAGVRLAVDLLKQAGAASGRILLITDGMEPYQAEEIIDIGGKHSLQILSVGTRAGGPIDLPERGYLKDGDTVIIAGNDTAVLQNLARQTGGRMVEMTLAEADLKSLQLTPNQADNEFLLDDNNDPLNINNQMTSALWQDRGYLLTIPLLLLALLIYRRGLLSILPALVTAFLLFPSPPAEASLWDDLWMTKDQQAAKALANGNAEAAAKLFKDPQWKASALYQAEKYAESAEAFTGLEKQQKEDKARADLWYNTGTALAKAQKFEEALKALDKTLELDPKHEDALANKQTVEEIIKKQQQDEQSQDDQSQEDQSQDSQSQDKQDQDQNQDQKESDSKDQQNNDDSSTGDPSNDSQNSQDDQNSQGKQDGQPESGDANESPSKDSESDPAQTGNAQQDPTKNDPNEPEAGKEAALTEAPAPLRDEEQQAFEQWMRRVPDDPSGLLRRKFAQQYENDENKKSQEGRPLW